MINADNHPISRPPQVVELSGNVAAAYCTKLIADTGATVFKIELPGGDPLRTSDANETSYFGALNLNKDSVVLDYQANPDLLDAWLDWADIVIHDLAPRDAKKFKLDAERIRKDYPALVCTAITPFGHFGPHADYEAVELNLAHGGGWANLCPATHENPDLAPLKVAGDHCQMMSAVSAAATTLACYRDARTSGAGEFIDFSIQAYVASVLEAAIPAYGYKEEVISRVHPRSLIPWRIFHAQDAPVFVVCIEQDQWLRLVKFMGDPEWASLPTFEDQPARQENQDLVHALVQEFVSTWKAADFYHAAQAERICVAPVMEIADLVENEHLISRKFFEHNGSATLLRSAVLTTQGRAPIRKLAPKLGNHASALPPVSIVEASSNSDKPARGSTKPLNGIRVLDLTWAWAGPFCSLNLAHLGAEVIRIESANRPDLYRRLPLFPEGEEGLNKSGMFNQWNQGKASMTVNLATEEGVQIIKDLIPHTDVVVQNFATGVLERMGLGYDILKDINPGIILASISGYGQSGPYRDYMGYGPAIPPLTGLSAATGYVDGEAEEIGLSMPDPTAGITAAYGVIAALIERDSSGVGEHLDVSLWEATAVLNAQAWMTHQAGEPALSRMGNRHPNMAPHGAFRTKGEDQWVSIACRNDREWQALAALMAVDIDIDLNRFTTLSDRLANVDALEAQVSEWTNSQDAWHITTTLQAIDIPAFPTFTTDDVVNDAHHNARGFIERLPHPEVGRRPHTGIPWLFSERANGVAKAAPCIDADSDHYLAELLAKSPTDITELRSKGIIGC
ncbi:MAG: crotonobetainyl-CoA:carnitine CoA-transferase CaiB-like acyl-CoA transferase [Candidatus Azotimanducaceae bacterium]|jgi:crotonobetainyl-CoA:carnitine CoA-transferase CaiB-like acyl-CoA transferase